MGKWLCGAIVYLLIGLGVAAASYDVHSIRGKTYPASVYALGTVLWPFGVGYGLGYHLAIIATSAADPAAASEPPDGNG